MNLQKLCEVKQENIQVVNPQHKSLNYQVKRKEAERIDSENQKIMERIVNQNASLSSKKMQQQYQGIIKYKKLKDQKMAISVEKILEKKRRMVMEARSTILPLLQTKQSSPGANHDNGKNFNIGGDSQSQRIIQNYPQHDSENGGLTDEIINIANTQTDYKQLKISNGRYTNKTQLSKISQSVTPKSQRQKRLVAKSELSDYRVNQKLQQSLVNKKPNKVVLESIKNPSKNMSISASVNSRLNKPPIVPLQNHQSKIIPKNQNSNIKNLNQSVNIKPSVNLPSLQNNDLSKSFHQETQSKSYETPEKNKIQDIDNMQDEMIEDEEIDQEVQEIQQKSKQQSPLNDESLIEEYEEEFVGNSKQNTKREKINEQKQIVENDKANQSSLIKDSFQDDSKFFDRNSIVSDQKEEEQYEEEDFEEEILE